MSAIAVQAPVQSSGRTGLRPSQAWTLSHIVRCECGSWMVLDLDRSLIEEALDGDTVCPHFGVPA